MNFRKQLLSRTPLGIIILVLLLTLGLPAARLVNHVSAQETTAEPTQPPAPTDVPTAAPTEIPPTEAPPTEVLPTDTPTEVPPVEATVEPVSPEVTTEPVNPELTEEPVATEAPTLPPTEEPTLQPTPTPVVSLFMDDFQDGDTAGWLLTPGWQVMAEADNVFLSASAPNEMATVLDPAWDNLTLTARVQVGAGDTALIAVKAAVENYTVALDGDGHAVLSRGGILLAEGPAVEPAPVEGETPAPAVWRTVTIQVLSGVVTVAVDGVEQISYTDATPMAAGTVIFMSGAANTGAVAVDDVTAQQLDAVLVTPEPEATEAATPEPEATDAVLPEATETVQPEATDEAAVPTPVLLSEENRAKLGGALAGVTQAIINGDDAAAQELAAAYFLPTDDAGRISVVVWVAEGYAAQDVAAIVTAVGGSVAFVNERNVEAYVPMAAFIALVNTVEVQTILPASVGTSTSSANAPVGSPANIPAGPVVSEGFDIIGANDWHTAIPNNVLGANVKIALIDTGFNGIAGLPTNERSCAPVNPPVGSLGTGSHGLNVIEVLCDVAPSATVTMYAANTASELAAQITAARTGGNKIILITLDLGANASPGDGTGGGAIDNVYTAITNARNAGRMVIVSAGNNRGRYTSFQYTSGTTNITITANAGDHINVSWDDWGGAGDDLTMRVHNGALIDLAKPARPGGGQPGYQFTVPTLDSCVAAPGALCTLTLEISGATASPNYVQVQATGVGTVGSPVGGTVSNINTSASLGRPADSQDAITVGAVCAVNDSTNGAFPQVVNSLGDPTSSIGPVFGSGGTAPGSSSGSFPRQSVKPDLVGPSDVSTTSLPITNSDCKSDDTDGFGGTSAAAAHVAGMAALLVSSTEDNLSAFDAGDATAVNELQDYMQTHSIDLPLNNPDGFDMRYGSGLAVLGNPKLSFNWSGLTDPTLPAATCASRIYVSTANPDSAQDGSLANPYVSPAYALRHAVANQCVILLPGEYVTPIQIPDSVANGVVMQSYDAALASDEADSTFWVNNGFESGGGIEVSARTNTITISGFTFYGAAPYYIPGPVSVSPLAIQVAGSSNATISGNLFTHFKGTLNGSTPVVVTGSQNITIDGNTFTDNDNLSGAALKIQVSGDTTPILVQNNTFTDNWSSQTFLYVSEPVLLIGNSQVDVYTNRFVGNHTHSLVRVSNANDAYEVSLFSNLFMDNLNDGPVIHLDPGRRFRFINNTVAHQPSMSNLTYSVVIARGNGPEGSGSNGGGLWEIHNNLFYDNNAFNGLIQDLEINATCDSISGGAASDDGARNNWYFKSGKAEGDCQGPLTTAAFNNITVDPLPYTEAGSQFAGSLLAPNDPYRLRGVGNGIDTGNDAMVTAAGITLATATDVLGGSRYEDGNSDTTFTIDIGAYEFLSVKGGPVVATLDEDTPSAPIAFFAEGGFPPYSFTITSSPAFYDTDVNNACGGQPYLQTSLTAGTFTYCPPKNFYNVGYPLGAIDFTYDVRDQGGSVSHIGTITIDVNPTDDPAQVDPITHTIRIEENQTDNTAIIFRMRPYVRLDDNFFFSEDNDGTNSNGADYPYTYSYVLGSATGDLGIIVGGETAIINAISAANATNGRITTLFSLADQTGTVTFKYRTTDADGQPVSPVDNTVEVNVVPLLPDSGIHDDTSFAFTYTGTGWTPIYSEVNINNTLHQTRVLNDEAEFNFVGTGFAAYIQGSAAGGYWELKVDGQSFTWNGNKTVSKNGVVCRTTAVTGTTALGRGNQIYNRTVLPYIVSCSRLRADDSHTVLFINRDPLYLNIDAVGILVGDNALHPGLHDVGESQIARLFYGGWTQIADRFASGQVAMQATSASVPDIEFNFIGSGIEVGTVLERFYNPLTRTYGSTSYDICVTPAGGAGEVCQTFDNGMGTPPPVRPIYNVFRPLVGFDPALEHTARIHINSVPANGRLLIDSITVLDAVPLGTLPFGTTEDDVFGMLVTDNGKADSWRLDTFYRAASNSSLTTINRGIPYAGPFITFQIPATADTVNWFRYASRIDSQYMEVCVDRGLGVAGDGYGNCIIANLRTGAYSRLNTDGSLTAGTETLSLNPLVIRESLFRESWTGVTSHTVEIFSLTNETFNLDRVQVIGSTLPFQKGYYEQDVPGIRTFDGTPAHNLDAGLFTTVVNRYVSGGSYMETSGVDSGILFQFNGTGFAVDFNLNFRADTVKICVVDGTTTNVNTVLAGYCRIFNNESRATVYKAARSMLGLTPGNHTAVVQMLADDNTPLPHNVLYPILMQIDAIEVFNTWNTLNTLDTPGMRYETSYVNQASDNNFLYYGTGWRSISGRAAALYSGQNYDMILRQVGAGIVFHTNNADTVRLIRNTRAGYSPLLVCTAPHDGAFNVNMSQYACVTVRNDGGTAYQQIFNIPLSSSGPHVVSVTTLNTGYLYLDAIELANHAALTPGVYRDDDPGLVYSPLDSETTAWRNRPIARVYSDNSAMESTAPGASVTFSCVDCTGFTLFNTVDRYTGLVDVTVTGTTNGSAPLNLTRSFNTYSLYLQYRGALSMNDLPIGDYTFTITESDLVTNKFIVDGLTIYGDHNAAMAPGLYDDAAVDSSGLPYLSFGPTSADWYSRTGTAARAYMGQSIHYGRSLGGQVRFNVTSADTITLFHSGSLTTNVEVCATRLTANPVSNTSRTCTTINPRTNGASTTLGASLFAQGVGSYAVSVTNLQYPYYLYLDAVGVYNSTLPLAEGMYQDSHPSLSAGFKGVANGGLGTWLPNTLETLATDRYVNSTGIGDAGDYLEFSFNGVGFSIILVESTLTSGNYTLNVDGVDTVITPTPLSTAKKQVAITRVGLSNGLHTVRLTNNDAAKPLLVDRVDILEQPGADQRINNNTTGNIENTDARIIYFPFNSLAETRIALASGGSQHAGLMQGSVVFFELNAFNGSAVQYVRQTSTAYGTVNVCYGSTYGAAPTCTPVANNGANAYQAAQPVSITGGANTWVSIENTDGKTMPLDFIRPVDANDPLTAGYYEDTFAAVSNKFNFDGSFVETVSRASSGGTVQKTTTENATAFFQFNGTGFSMYFVLDRFADAVDICWVDSATPTTAAEVLADGTKTCERFDNESLALTYKAARTVLGLSSGVHSVAVQMLADDGQPVPHLPTLQPISMQVDAIQIYNDALPANVLNTLGINYETNYNNRVADGMFSYYGSAWRTYEGRYAPYRSGSNYDATRLVTGAGVVFQTSGANSVVLYRDIRAGYAPVQACAIKVGPPQQRQCITINNATGTGYQQPVAIPLFDSTQHIITLTTLNNGIFNLDAIRLVDASAPLTAGMYDDTYPGLIYSGTDWASKYYTLYSEGHVAETLAGTTLTNGDPATAAGSMVFQFTGTGFEIGTQLDRYGGEVQICYKAGAPVDPMQITLGNGATCHLYQNENARTSYYSSYVIGGLANDTYSVRVQNVEDGFTSLTTIPNTPRSITYPVKLRVDYVRVFDTLPPTVTTAGIYNDNAVDGSGVPYLQPLPAERWGAVTGRYAAAYSGSSYTTLVDRNNRLSRLYSGPALALRVDVPADGATVILYTDYRFSRIYSNQFLVCADGGTFDILNSANNKDCKVFTSLTDAAQVVLTSADFLALGSPGTHTLTFRTLTPSGLTVDGFQVIHGSVLSPGVYDSFLASSGGLLNTTGTWTTMKYPRAYGGTYIRSNTQNDLFTFDFDGTGFSIVTQSDPRGVDFRVCYVLQGDFDGAFDGSGTETCQNRSTDTTLADWRAANGTRPLPVGYAYQYGFDIYGLPAGIYTAEVRIQDGTILVPYDYLNIDAVTIFGDVSNGGTATPLMPGQLYDDTDVMSVDYAPGHNWTLNSAYRYGPWRGPWNRTEHVGKNAGTVMQVYLQGNALVLYQTGSTRNSRNIRVCLATNEGPQCSEFSQYVRPTYFTPVVFYGLGDGKHTLIFENQDHLRPFSVDAMQVLP